jgi:hypothetical protein
MEEIVAHRLSLEGLKLHGPRFIDDNECGRIPDLVYGPDHGCLSRNKPLVPHPPLRTKMKRRIRTVRHTDIVRSGENGDAQPVMFYRVSFLSNLVGSDQSWEQPKGAIRTLVAHCK